MKPIPTIAELFERIENDLVSQLNLTEQQLRRVLSAVATTLAGELKLLYLRQIDIQNNLYPDTADLAENGGELERLGLIYLNRLPNPATAGEYTSEVFGQPGSILRAGLTFKSNDDSQSPGFLFVLDAQYTLVGPQDFITIRALTAGTESILDVNDNLTITEPVIGVDQTVTITVVITEPRAAESTGDFRQDIVDAIQLEPQGGARTDYRLWASDAQGVRRVYPYVNDGNPGEVDVFVEATVADSIDGNGTPSAQLLQDVEDVIELDPDITKPINERGRRPIQATINTLSIILLTVDVTITGLNEDTPEIRNAIENAIIAFLFDVRPFIAGTDLIRNKNDILFSGRLQGAVIDVLDSSNFFTGFQMDVDGNVVDSFLFDDGNIPYLQNLVFA